MPSVEKRPDSGPEGPARGSWSQATASSSGAPPTHHDQSFKRGLHRTLVNVLRAAPKSLVRLAADAYIAGETREEALRVVERLWREKKIQSTCDVLGEDVETDADIQAYYDEFHGLIQDMASRRDFGNVSIKLSALGQQLDEEKCYERIHTLMMLARDCGQFMRLDMEDHTTTESTLRIYRRLRAEGLDNCGVVLQSRLFRTEQDILDLKDLAPNVRLCIGIYREPPQVALQNKGEMKRHLLELLEVLWKNGQHVGIASHEEWVVRDSIALARKLGKPLEEVEVQMLLGVPRAELQRELIDLGVRVRLYVPYGVQWHAYSMRRLENNPDMMGMVAWNMISGPFRKK